MRILIIGSQWVHKQSQDFAYHSERLFPPELSLQGSINMVKVLSFINQQRFGPLTTLLEPLKQDFLDIYLTTFFKLRKFISYEGQLFHENV